MKYVAMVVRRFCVAHIENLYEKATRFVVVVSIKKIASIRMDAKSTRESKSISINVKKSLEAEIKRKNEEIEQLTRIKDLEKEIKQQPCEKSEQPKKEIERLKGTINQRLTAVYEQQQRRALKRLKEKIKQQQDKESEESKLQKKEIERLEAEIKQQQNKESEAFKLQKKEIERQLNVVLNQPDGRIKQLGEEIARHIEKIKNEEERNTSLNEKIEHKEEKLAKSIVHVALELNRCRYECQKFVVNVFVHKLLCISLLLTVRRMVNDDVSASAWDHEKNGSLKNFVKVLCSLGCSSCRENCKIKEINWEDVQNWLICQKEKADQFLTKYCSLAEVYELNSEKVSECTRWKELANAIEKLSLSKKGEDVESDVVCAADFCCSVPLLVSRVNFENELQNTGLGTKSELEAFMDKPNISRPKIPQKAGMKEDVGLLLDSYYSIFPKISCCSFEDLQSSVEEKDNVPYSVDDLVKMLLYKIRYVYARDENLERFEHPVWHDKKTPKPMGIDDSGWERFTDVMKMNDADFNSWICESSSRHQLRDAPKRK